MQKNVSSSVLFSIAGLWDGSPEGVWICGVYTLAENFLSSVIVKHRPLDLLR